MQFPPFDRAIKTIKTIIFFDVQTFFAFSFAFWKIV